MLLTLVVYLIIEIVQSHNIEMIEIQKSQCHETDVEMS